MGGQVLYPTGKTLLNLGEGGCILHFFRFWVSQLPLATLVGALHKLPCVIGTSLGLISAYTGSVALSFSFGRILMGVSNSTLCIAQVALCYHNFSL